MFKVIYHDDEPQDMEIEFETEQAMCEWVTETMRDAYHRLCDRFPKADVTWINRFLDCGCTTEVYVPDTSIYVSCEIV